MKNNKINKTAKSYLAKLLATENISVEHRKVKTAFFDLKLVMLYLLHNKNGMTQLKKKNLIEVF